MGRGRSPCLQPGVDLLPGPPRAAPALLPGLGQLPRTDPGPEAAIRHSNRRITSLIVYHGDGPPQGAGRSESQSSLGTQWLLSSGDLEVNPQRTSGAVDNLQGTWVSREGVRLRTAVRPSIERNEYVDRRRVCGTARRARSGGHPRKRYRQGKAPRRMAGARVRHPGLPRRKWPGCGTQPRQVLAEGHWAEPAEPNPQLARLVKPAPRGD
jgi:hypothetical protein